MRIELLSIQRADLYLAAIIIIFEFPWLINNEMNHYPHCIVEKSGTEQWGGREDLFMVAQPATSTTGSDPSLSWFCTSLCPHLWDGDTEAQKGESPCPRPCNGQPSVEGRSETRPLSAGQTAAPSQAPGFSRGDFISLPMPLPQDQPPTANSSDR